MTASLELSRKLYELSGWYDCSHVWKDDIPQRMYEMSTQDNCYPAYDLGYLLRKLPKQLDNGGLLYLNTTIDGKWSCGHRGTYYKQGNTPENAACSLAIKLFEQNILKKETSK